MAVLRTSFGDHHACWAASRIWLPPITQYWKSDPLSPPTRRGTQALSRSCTLSTGDGVRTAMVVFCLLGAWYWGGGARCGRGQWRSFVKLRFLGALGDGWRKGGWTR